MIWRFRFRKARTRARDKAQDRGDWAPIPNEVRRATQQEFHAWAAMVRTSVEAIQALAEEIKDRDRALEDLLQSPKPDPAAIGALVLEIQARRTEMPLVPRKRTASRCSAMVTVFLRATL